MLTAIYRRGGRHNVWGVMADIKQVQSNEIDEYLSNGWLGHPAGLLNIVTEPEPEPEPDLAVKKHKKPGPKPKAATDEYND